jgi:hypothetical protein
MVAEAAETCRWIAIYDKKYFIAVHLSVGDTSLNIPQCKIMENIR